MTSLHSQWSYALFWLQESFCEFAAEHHMFMEIVWLGGVLRVRLIRATHELV